jgi:hypothetical protein
MNTALRGLHAFCLVYLDDIIIFSRSWDDHLMHLEQVFDRLRSANMRARLRKCRFGAPALEYLGHIVGRDGVRPDPAKVDKIVQMQRPATLTELRAFLGLVGYYRRFIHRFALKAQPLTGLLKPDATSLWRPGWPEWHDNPPLQHSFDVLRTTLISAPILRYPDFSRPFILQTDASGRAVGAVLSQIFDDGEHPVAYASKTLTESAGRRIPAELECLAAVWAVRHFRAYIHGRPFVLETDHLALKYLQDHKDESSLLFRWALKLQSFDFVTRHRSGAKNKNADGLTRLRFADDGQLEDVDDDDEAFIIFESPLLNRVSLLHLPSASDFSFLMDQTHLPLFMPF